MPATPLIAALTSGGLTGRRGLHRHPFTGTTRTRTGDMFRVDTTDLIEQYIYLFGVWEPDLQAWLRGRLQKGDVVIDVGANIGTVSIPAARLVGPNGSVVAVEAVPSIIERLRTNVALNSLTNVRIIECAASNRSGEITLHMPSKYNRGGTSIIDTDRAEGRFTVPSAPLSELLRTDEVGGARIIKIDVEGAEPEVIDGLIPILDDMRHDLEIHVEISPGRMGVNGHTIHSIFVPLERAGFHAYLLRNTYSALAYPPAIRKTEAPRRVRHPVTEQCDVIFSRIDAPDLQPLHPGLNT